MIFISGATGQLGTAVINALRTRHPPSAEIVAGSRKPEAAAAFATRGIQVRTADYADPASLVAAYHQGIEVLYLVSGDATHRDPWWHRNAIAAAVKAGVKARHIPASSIPREDSPFGFAPASTRIPSGRLRKRPGNHDPASRCLCGHPAGLRQWFRRARCDRLPATHRARRPSSRADLAAAAAVVLCAREYAGKTYADRPVGAGTCKPGSRAARGAGGKPVCLPGNAGSGLRRDAGAGNRHAGLAGQALAGMFVAMDRGGYDNQSGDFARLLGRDALPVEAVLAEQLGL